MKEITSRLLLGLFLVAGLALLLLTNTGILSFDRPYLSRLTDELPELNPIVAFSNVNLVPMDRERVVENQTVVVRDGVVEMIGTSGQIDIPTGALVVDGTGQYLMPGLVDMHTHIEFENDLLLLVANGVTSIRNMWGNTGRKSQFGGPDQLALRQKIEQGALLGPTIYTAGPIMEGEPPFHPMVEVFSSPEQAAESVAWQKAQGYDFIKVYAHLAPEVYQAIMVAAEANDISVVGHVPFSVGLDDALASGQQTIEHFTGYIDPDEAAFMIPMEQFENYAARTRQAGVWNCVTLSLYPKSKETPDGLKPLKNQAGII
jgi:hypothetical protein